MNNRIYRKIELAKELINKNKYQIHLKLFQLTFRRQINKEY